jgi:putative DNA primase/helicase
MVALGAVIGRRVGIAPKRRDDWLVVPNIWGGVVGRPGVMKTPALSEAMRPLRRLEAEEAEQHAEDMQDYQLQQMVSKAREKALTAELEKSVAGKGGRAEVDILKDLKRQRSAEGEPVCIRYETNDATVEKLGELLADNPNGILMFRDELVGWLRNLDKAGHEGSRAFFLEAWDGKGAFTFDRIGRGTLRIEAACVSIMGGVQPGPLAGYVRDAGRAGAGADGLLQRFQLLVFPDEPLGWRNVDRWPDSEARNNAFCRFCQLAELDASKISADRSGQTPFLRFDDAAAELFTEWRVELEKTKLRQGEPEIIEAHLSKYRSLVPSLALICHLADGGTGPVSELAMVKAAAWAEYLESHARRIYSLAMEDNGSTVALAGRIRSGDVEDGFVPRDIYRKGWAGLDKDGTWRAVEGLEALRWLRVRDIRPDVGRPSKVCHINPRIFE